MFFLSLWACFRFQSRQGSTWSIPLPIQLLVPAVIIAGLIWIYLTKDPVEIGLLVLSTFLLEATVGTWYHLFGKSIMTPAFKSVMLLMVAIVSLILAPIFVSLGRPALALVCWAIGLGTGTIFGARRFRKER